LIHAVLVAAFIVALLTGLRIASDDPQSLWLTSLDAILPTDHLWYRHALSSMVLTAVLGGYAAYVRSARLGARIRFDRARLLTMLSAGPARFAAANVLVFWWLMGALTVEIASGFLLFSGFGSRVLDVHRDVSFLCVGLIVLHILLHALYGGLGQLLRIVRPSPLHIAPPPPDLADLLADHLARHAPTVNDAVVEPLPANDAGVPRRRSKISAHPLVNALALAIAIGGGTVWSERFSRTELVVTEVNPDEVPRLDGDLSDPVWLRTAAVSVLTTQGGDFGGTHQSTVDVRAVHDGVYAYFAFTWDDPTRSLKHLPLVKRGGNWRMVTDSGGQRDESRYYEDKFAVLLTRTGLPLIGAAIHLGADALAGHPAGATGRGFHFTTDGNIADVWQWRASHSGTRGHIDNGHFGPPAERSVAGEGLGSRYAGGYQLDPAPVPYRANVDQTDNHESTSLRPLRLPRDVRAMAKAIGGVVDGASDGESATWSMEMADTVPYSVERDAAIPEGTIIPSVLFTGEDASTIRGVARWAAGRWTLELARRLYTNSPLDVPIKSGAMMWVAAFDHAEKRHTRHIRPFILKVQ
jgi:hypothetical protein